MVQPINTMYTAEKPIQRKNPYSGKTHTEEKPNRLEIVRASTYANKVNKCP